MSIRPWQDVLDVGFPCTGIVTIKMQEAAFKQVQGLRGEVRLMLGRLITSEEIEDRRQCALQKPLRT